MSTSKSLTERVFQAIGFELFAVLLCTPLFAWVMSKPLLDMGVVTVANCLLALGWNVLFNGLFDRLLERLALTQNGWTRLLHAVLFEGGLIVVSVPLIAWWLELSLLSALLLDIGVLLFFLPYTYVYHWVYDLLRERVLLRRMA
ncbi:multidrug/biocide efflux PACE transporter [Pseudomonas asplenii]|uniref:multidrug/biocide efflux PACE transporter n=1 Tax=Pseudomonas asplenii TaxID=53407 RepID=UPI00036A17DF|nr:multidrug/biocide efflux PACE transporter [Pseudomonas fuscovaginae]